jgi:hypothetical protein
MAQRSCFGTHYAGSNGVRSTYKMSCSATVSVVTFERLKVVRIPSQFEHWGLFVRYEDGTDKLYHADKTALTNIQTKYEEKDWSPGKSNKMDCIVLVGYTSTSFNQDTMTKPCEDVTRDRVFNTLTSNSQGWVKVVLSSLIKDNYLGEGAFEELKFDSEITPLFGW